MPNSQNGWPASANPNAIGITTLTLSNGKRFQAASAVAPNLMAMAEWWNANIEPITMIGGYNFREIRGYENTGIYSNHASGTAIDINWDKHPLGARGTVTESQANAIRKKAAELGLRWGGDYRGRADEMHFEVNVPPSQLPEVRDGFSTAQIIGISVAALGVSALVLLARRRFKY